MGCGASSLKGSEDVGTNDTAQPSVPTNDPTGASMKKIKTNFSTVDYDAPAENHKGSILKARAPDELDEGPSRHASRVSPTATNAATRDISDETENGGMEEPATTEQQNKLEPYHTVGGEPVSDEYDNQHAGGKTPGLVQ